MKLLGGLESSMGEEESLRCDSGKKSEMGRSRGEGEKNRSELERHLLRAA